MPLADPPRPPAGTASTLLVTLDPEGARVDAYAGPVTLDAIRFPAEARLFAFYYPRTLTELALEPGVVPQAGEGPSREIPPADLELELVEGDPWTWLELGPRPIELDAVRLPGTTPGGCAAAGGCYLNEQALELQQCTLACQDQISVQPAEPAVPRITGISSCPPGWQPSSALQVPFPDLVEREPITFPSCVPPDRVPSCTAAEYQPASASDCRTAALCDDGAWFADLTAFADGHPIRYVGTRPEGAPAGEEVATLSAALSASGTQDVVAVPDGEYSFGPGVAHGAVIVGRCPERTVLTFDGPAELPPALTVARATLRLAGTGIYPLSGTLEIFNGYVVPVGGPVVSMAGGTFRVTDGALGAAGAAVNVTGEGTFELDSVEWKTPALTLMGSVRLSDVRTTGLDTRWIDVSGPQLRVEQAILAVPVETESDDARLSHAVFRREDGVAARGRLEVTGGAARLEDSGFAAAVQPMVLSGGRLELRHVWSVGGGGWAIDVREGDLDAEDLYVDDDGLRVDDGGQATVRDWIAEDSGEAAVLMMGGEATIDRVLWTNHSTAITLRQSFDFTLRDAWVQTKELRSCEPFVIGPAPRRSERERRERLGYDCVFEGSSFEPPEAEYELPWSATIERMFVRDRGGPGALKSAMRAVGNGALVVRDVDYPRVPGRGLLVQGPVQVDLRSLWFRNAALNGACVYPGLRMEPARVSSRRLDEFPSGTVDGLRVDNMPVGIHFQVGAEVNPDVTFRNILIDDVRVGVVHVVAGDGDVFAEPQPERWLVRASYTNLDGGLVFAASPNPPCD